MSLILDGTNGLSDVDGSAATPAIRGSDANTGVFFGTDIVGVSTGGTERVRVDASGNVGIGTVSPDANITVNGAASFAAGTALLPSIARAGDLNTGIFFPAADTIAFAEGGAEVMRINSSGNVGIGTTTPAHKLDVVGTARASSFLVSNGDASITNGSSGDSRPLFISNSSASGLPNGSLYINNTNNPNNTSYVLMQAVAGASQKFIVYGNGTTQNGTGVYGTISDERIKKDIVDTSPKLDKLLQVRVVNYTRTDDPTESRQLGVIAQELEQVFPGLVDVVAEKDVDGNVTCPDRKSVKYSIFVPMLIKAIQEQQAIITALTARVEALEGVQP